MVEGKENLKKTNKKAKKNHDFIRMANFAILIFREKGLFAVEGGGEVYLNFFSHFYSPFLMIHELCLWSFR